MAMLVNVSCPGKLVDYCLKLKLSTIKSPSTLCIARKLGAFNLRRETSPTVQATMSPSAGGVLATAALRAFRKNLASTSKMVAKLVRSKIAATRATAAELQPIAIRSHSRQPIHPAAWLRQQKRAGGSKWYSTANINAAVRRYLSTGNVGQSSGGGFRFDRSKLPISNTSRAVAQLTARAPFASTLRPNLTGGALPRTAGGYAMPGCGRAGGARFFSHTPAAPAQVVQNVSQAMRAFWLSGQRARYDGLGPNGEKRYRAVGATQEAARVRMGYTPRNTPGSFIDFQVGPTITALSPLGAADVKGAATLNEEGFLDVLSVDFARVLQDLAAVMTDLKKVSDLGDLPIALEKGNVLRIRFPGVDAQTVERLCDDIGVQRGVVGQDPDFDVSAGVPVALRFPCAPGGSCANTITSPGGSLRSHDSESSDIEEAFFVEEIEENPWHLSSLSDYEEGYESAPPLEPASSSSGDYEGLEGIYRFIEECDRAKGRL
ncbi:hypothetical protein B0T21DRAFT_343683 [Apiosordaria backusii]|uniref:Casein kinase II beta 2 subunit n=1 Tax=Apiosordaria backusii TaxID=314023 RepID=A0AA40EYM8_9PEZI|nr:hypothetical protein B0T21DRAFT_343683 [Apiosordaria backusii]